MTEMTGDDISMPTERTSEDTPKTSVDEFDLPRGYVHVTGKGEKVLFNRARFKELTGAEEDVITNDKLSFTNKMVQVVRGCTVALIGENGQEVTGEKDLVKAIPKMTIGDLTVALFRIREMTVGNEYRQIVTCPNENCLTLEEKPFSWTAMFNLSEDFPLKPCSGDPHDVVREFITERGTKVTWSFMTGEARIRYENTATSKDRATAVMMMRARTINDKPATKEVLRSLSMPDRAEIREKMVADEGGIDTSFDAECKNCGHEFKGSIVSSFDFFFPSALQED
jgi:hypothetical protein